MINKHEFLEIYSFIDREVLVEIIDIFLAEYVSKIDKLYIDVKSQDFRALRYDAHSLKGMVANFYDKQVWELAKVLEEMGARLIDDPSNYSEQSLTEIINTLNDHILIMATKLQEIKEELISSAG